MRPITVVRIIGWSLAAIGVICFLRTTPSPEIRNFSMRFGKEVYGASRLRGIVRDGSSYIVWEGLPPQPSQAILDEAITHEFRNQLFYSGPLGLSSEDAERFIHLFTSPGSLQPWSGFNPVDPFHPDLALEWAARGQVYRAFLSFRSNEIRTYGPGLARRVDMSPRTSQALRELLRPYCRRGHFGDGIPPDVPDL